MTQALRAIIYARYSTDLQRPQSIEDQYRLCQRVAEQQGWEIVAQLQDGATSGATINRSGLNALRSIITSYGTDIILVEAFDRLSRDMADMATLHKEAEYHNVRFYSVADGFATPMTVGLRSMMDSEFLRALKQKTHRGLEGVILEGRHTARPPYGYCNDPAAAPDKRGVLAIHPKHADVVRRIYRDYAEGKSPIAIAKALNADGIPSPTGKPWRDTTIRGHATRQSGILRNPIYHGTMVWNRTEYRKHYETGLRQARVRSADEYVTREVPQLRIIDEPLWRKVQDRLKATANSGKGRRSDLAKGNTAKDGFWNHRRTKHFLSGLMVCGTCGGAMGNAGKDYIGCTNARKSGTCTEKKSVRRAEVESLVLDSLQHRLMDPNLLADFIKAVQAEAKAALKAARQKREQTERTLDALRKKEVHLVDAIADGHDAKPLMDRLTSIENEITALEVQLAQSEEEPVLNLDDDLAAVYRARVADLARQLRSPDAEAARQQLRDLIERVVISHDAAQGHRVTLEGAIVEMLELASAFGATQKPALAGAGAGDLLCCSVKVVAGAGFEPATFRL
ncbi:recombinase family protein [Aquibaculum arenosum]|uniref:recombinase family protein n=1 Tax=Aquibaculum arenosum TaxID=3032591 RepID=UPI00345FD05B